MILFLQQYKSFSDNTALSTTSKTSIHIYFSIPRQKLENLFSRQIPKKKKKVQDSYRMGAVLYIFSFFMHAYKRVPLSSFPENILTLCRILKADFIRISQKRAVPIIFGIIFWRKALLKRVVHVYFSSVKPHDKISA